MSRNLAAMMVALVMAASGGCASTLSVEQAFTPKVKTRVFNQPPDAVWAAAERVLRSKQAEIALADRDAGLLRCHLDAGQTHVTMFLEPLPDGRTRVYVSRSRGSHSAVDESALLAELARWLPGS